MSQTASPYGMLPVQQLGSGYNNAAYTEYPMFTNDTHAFGTGDPVSIVNGSVTLVTTSPTTSANTPVGVFMGCSYMDPVLGFVNRPYLPANAVTNGLTNIKVKVADSRNQIFKIQGNAQISGTLNTALQAVGKNVAITGFQSANANTGASGIVATTGSVATTNTLALRIIGFETNPSNSPTDNYPDLLVKWNAGVHAYENSTGQ